MAKNNIAGSLDTNVLLRLLLDDVAPHTKAVEKILLAGKKFEIADVAIIEMIFVFEKIYGFTRQEILENVYALIRNSQFIANRTLFEQALPLYESHPKLSIVDCALLTYARLNHATPLYSFDKDLAKLGGGDASIVS